MKVKGLLGGLAFTVLIGLLPVSARASSLCDMDTYNLVQNCGFETGDFTDWTTVAAAQGSDFFVTNANANSGSWAAWFGGTDPSDVDTISQTLTTTPGDTYSFSFFLDESTAADGIFQAFVNGTQELSVSGAGSGVYQQYSYTFTGTGSDTISFDGNSNTSFYYLDDVQVDDVSGVPEPASAFLLGAGLLGVAMVSRRRRRA